jgi:hypothetical protein
MHHIPTMRTTVDLADHLLVRAKKLAASQRTTLTAVLEDSLRAYLTMVSEQKKQTKRPFELPVGDGGKPLRGVDLNDTSSLMDIP